MAAMKLLDVNVWLALVLPVAAWAIVRPPPAQGAPEFVFLHAAKNSAGSQIVTSPS